MKILTREEFFKRYDDDPDKLIGEGFACPVCGDLIDTCSHALSAVKCYLELKPGDRPFTINTGNPKDSIGASKAPTSTTSRRVLMELGLAMLEGECQYWRHNYRAADVRAMVYIDAMERHIAAWVEGQDIDPKSGLSHLVKAMACLMIVRDAQLYGSLIDDRPPAQADPNWIEELNAEAARLIETHKGVVRGAYTEANRAEWPEFSKNLGNGPIKVAR